MTVQLIAGIKRFIGLSTDIKPTGVPVGSEFFEYNTRATYSCYNGTNWNQKRGEIIARDTFTDANGVLLENHTPDSGNFRWDVVNGTWKIKDNKAQNNPGLGSELVQNEGFETGGTGDDFNGGAEIDDGANDNFTIWVEDTTNGRVEATATVNGGSVAVKLVNTAGGVYTGLRLYQDFNVTSQTLYKYFFYTRGDGTNEGHFSMYDVSNALPIINYTETGISAAAYSLVSVYFITPIDCTVIRPQLAGSSANGSIIYYDDISVKQVALNEIFATVDLGITEGIFDVDVTIPTANDSHVGLVLALDSDSSPANWIEVFYNRGTGKVEVAKFVAGSRTSLINITATYAAGASPRTELTISGSDLLVDVIYNNVSIGAQQTISNAGIVGNTRHGIMNVSSSNSLDNFRVTSK